MVAEKSKTLPKVAAALAVIVPVLLTSIASYIESRQAKAALAEQTVTHKVDEARYDIWIRDQWVVQTNLISELRAEVAELRGEVTAMRASREARARRLGSIEDPFRGAAAGLAFEPPAPAPLPAAMPAKPDRGDDRVQKAIAP